jgi:hypothetical protein
MKKSCFFIKKIRDDKFEITGHNKDPFTTWSFFKEGGEIKFWRRGCVHTSIKE